MSMNDAQYRHGPLRRANIYLEEEIPTHINHYIENRVFNTPDNDGNSLQQASEKFQGKSKELARKPSGEAEWTHALHTAINDLRPAGLRIVRDNDWLEDMKPPVHNPLPRPLHAAATTPVFSLEDPRPAICVGLSDESLAGALESQKGRVVARNLLFDLQDTSNLISDPHVTSLGLRFPFLIVETKAGATGGNLYQAQNQAAVGGSTALQIFRNLVDLCDAQLLDRESQGDTDRLGPTPALSDDVLNLAFSITTEGPIHELWVHFQRSRDEDFCMACLGTWRTTLKDGSLDFLRHVLAVLKWGNGELKDNVVGALQGL
ncbi:hypothetical protein P170DRAFT_380442, partial [Aspergillus steynii IBT 23096]